MHSNQANPWIKKIEIHTTIDKNTNSDKIMTYLEIYFQKNK